MCACVRSGEKILANCLPLKKDKHLLETEKYIFFNYFPFKEFIFVVFNGNFCLKFNSIIYLSVGRGEGFVFLNRSHGEKW